MPAHATNKTNLATIKTDIATLRANASLGTGDSRIELTRLAKALEREIALLRSRFRGSLDRLRPLSYPARP